MKLTVADYMITTAYKMTWEFAHSLRKISGTDIAGPVMPLYTKLEFDEFLEDGDEDYALECLKWMAEYFPNNDYTTYMIQRVEQEIHRPAFNPEQDGTKQPSFDGKDRFYLYSGF